MSGNRTCFHNLLSDALPNPYSDIYRKGHRRNEKTDRPGQVKRHRESKPGGKEGDEDRNQHPLGRSPGEPLGYRKASGVQLLCNSEQEAAFGKFADRFPFKDAKREYGKRDQATKDFLDKCIAKGILKRVAKGVYEKVKPAE